MIVILYEEATVDAATGTEIYLTLGHEAHHGIEQVLLPVGPTAGNPIFLTKKFIGHAEYRWQVHSVQCEPSADRLTYRVRLVRRTQIDKQYYLKNILAARRKGARGVLHPWALVEVEFGHHFIVGDGAGRVQGEQAVCRYDSAIQHAKATAGGGDAGHRAKGGRPGTGHSDQLEATRCRATVHR